MISEPGQKPFTKDFRSMINIVIFNSLGFFFLEFLIPYFTSQQLNASGTEIGLIVSVQVTGFLITSFFTGYLTDKVKSRTRLILLGSFGRGAAYFILYLSLILKSLVGIGIGTFSIGFFAGFFWIPFDTLIAEKSSKDHRAYAYGRRDSAIGKGILIGAFLGFGIFNFTVSYNLSPFIIYLAILIFGIANFYAGWLFIRKVDETIKFPHDNLLNSDNLGENRSSNNNTVLIIGLAFILIVLLLANINGTLAKPFLNVYLLEVIVSDPIIANLAYIPSGIISMLLAPKLGKLADKMNPTLGITISSILGALMTWIIINTRNVFIFSIVLIFDSTVVSTANLILQNLLSRMSIKHRGKVFGSFRFFINLGSIIGPIIGGLAWDTFGFSAPFIISIFVELSLIPFYIIAIYLIKPHLREKYKEKIKISPDISSI